MLELSSLGLRNFLSYGDYDTELKLDDLGACLITGENRDVEDYDPAKDVNGIGKSGLLTAIQWCLFGRTTTNANPGASIINRDVGTGTITQLTLKDGSIIRRTRDVDGHSDLLYIDGDGDRSLSTNKIQQEALNAKFGLDWNLFNGMTFFAQRGRALLELSDTARREAMEKEFRLNRLLTYAEIAKDKKETLEKAQEQFRIKINSHQLMIANLTSELVKLQTAAANFDNSKSSRLNEAKRTLERLKAAYDAIEVLDQAVVTAEWAKYRELEKLAVEFESKTTLLVKESDGLCLDIGRLRRIVKDWEARSGGVCAACEQSVSREHIELKIDEPLQEIDGITDRTQQLAVIIAERRTKAAMISKLLESKRPPYSIEEAKRLIVERGRCLANIAGQLRSITAVESEENHYVTSITQLNIRIGEASGQIDEMLVKIKQIDTILLYIIYIYKAYNDRRKIRKYVLDEYIRSLNPMIAGYLGRFNLPIQFEFTDTLGVKTNCWDYEFFSGGEQKRIDLALMLAMSDLHTEMYGRQCNVMVFDEVDGRLDRRGAEVFADIVKNDLAARADAVLVISHRADMRGSLPAELKIIKEHNFSRLREIVK